MIQLIFIDVFCTPKELLLIYTAKYTINNAYPYILNNERNFSPFALNVYRTWLRRTKNSKLRKAIWQQ